MSFKISFKPVVNIICKVASNIGLKDSLNVAFKVAFNNI